MTITTPIPYREAANRVHALRVEARQVLAQVEKKSAPLNYKQSTYFEAWLDETFQVSSVHSIDVDSKLNELIDKLKELS